LNNRNHLDIQNPYLTEAQERMRARNTPAAEAMRPYTIDELAVLHNLSRQTVIRMYENESGVLIRQTSPEHQRKIGRRYRTIRVPNHVFMRVMNRMTVK
jgi:transcriptional regulator GlxA family with amidase domain